MYAKSRPSSVKLRIGVTITMLFLYGMAFNFYIYKLLTTGYDQSVLIYNWTTLLMLIFCVADWKMGFVSAHHKQFNFLGFLCLMVNYLFILLTHHKVLTDPAWMFITFNSGLFLVTASVFINAIRTKIFIE